MAFLPNTTTIPAAASAGGSFPSGTGFVHLTSGTPDDPAVPLGASDITTAVQDLQTSASPQFAGIQLGHASDTTLARSAAGQITVEGVSVATASNTLTLTNKTLTAPKLADGGFIADANGNEGLILTTTASAVNEVTLANAATGGNPKLSATGGDSNIGLDFQAKGTGFFRLLGNSTQPAELRLFEDTDNGSNYVGIKPPASVASNLTFTLPATTGAGKVLTDLAGDGVLTMETVSATDSTKLPLAGGTMTGAINVATGASHQRKINNVLVAETKELGGAAGPPCNVLYDAAGGNAMTETNSSGVIYLDLPSPDYRVRNAAASYARIGGWPLTPSDMPAGATSAGTQHLGDGTWRNQYSLAAGTHNGLIILADDQGKVALFSLVGTTVTLYANVAGSAWLNTTNATHGQLRCSGGYLQVILGVSMANRYVTTFFIGNVR